MVGVVNDDLLVSYIRQEDAPKRTTSNSSNNPGVDLYAKQSMILEQSRLLAERQAAICEQSRILASIQARNAADVQKSRPPMSPHSHAGAAGSGGAGVHENNHRESDAVKPTKEQSTVLNQTQASIFERSRDLAMEQASLFAEQQKIMAEIESRREAEEASLILALDLHRGETQGAGHSQNDGSYRMDIGP